MDPPLEDKVTFFRNLKAIQEGNNRFMRDGGDELDERDQAHRARCKSFFKQTSTKTREYVVSTASVASMVAVPPMAPSSASATPSQLQPQRAKSVSEELKDNGESSLVEIAEVIDLTSDYPNGGPQQRRQHRQLPQQIQEKTPDQPARLTRSSLASGIGSSSSRGPTKRKRDSTVELVPEDQQIFRGLSFFYLPNDDINAVRRARIRRAREHGATWSRLLTEATHVIVDGSLAWKDISGPLEKCPNWSEKTIVKDNYPLDCLKYGVLVKPDQEQYHVPGIPSVSMASPPRPGTASQSSHVPLQFKNKQRDVSIRDSGTPLSTPSKGAHADHRGQAISDTEHIVLSSQDGISSLQNQEDAPEDELSQCINLMQASQNPEGLMSGDEQDEKREASMEPDIQAESGPGTDSGEEYYGAGKQENQRLTHGRKPMAWQEKFRCMKGGTKDADDNGPNSRTIRLLQKLCDEYTLNNDKWRPLAYRKAIATLRDQPKEIATANEATQLPNIDDRIATKIEEIVRTGRLRRLEHEEKEVRKQRLQLFLQVYGVGPTLANKWVDKGYRDLEDIKDRAELTEPQRLGVEHFEDLNSRIPRQEMDAMDQYVRQKAAELDPAVQVIFAGSYRRGADSSGDIDFIITKKDTSSSEDLVPFLRRLVQKLEEEGFLTATLVALNSEASRGHGSKWHGCCVLPQCAMAREAATLWRPVWRRIDLLIVPSTEIGAALIYFTGNDIFNRSMRLLASRKGMRLNQRGLYKDVIRGAGRVKMTEGELVEGTDERRIFEILGVKWREPHERWC